MKISRFEDSECWREARSLVRKVYAATLDGTLNLQAEIREQQVAVGEWSGRFVVAVPALRAA